MTSCKQGGRRASSPPCSALSPSQVSLPRSCSGAPAQVTLLADVFNVSATVVCGASSVSSHVVQHALDWQQGGGFGDAVGEAVLQLVSSWPAIEKAPVHVVNTGQPPAAPAVLSPVTDQVGSARAGSADWALAVQVWRSSTIPADRQTLIDILFPRPPIRLTDRHIVVGHWDDRRLLAGHPRYAFCGSRCSPKGRQPDIAFHQVSSTSRIAPSLWSRAVPRTSRTRCRPRLTLVATITSLSISRPVSLFCCASLHWIAAVCLRMHAPYLIGHGPLPARRVSGTRASACVPAAALRRRWRVGFQRVFQLLVSESRAAVVA